MTFTKKVDRTKSALEGRVTFEKQYVSREISGFKSTISNTFQYLSMAEAGSEIFVHTLKEIMSCSLSRDDQSISDVEAEFKTLVEMAGNVFNPSCWLLPLVNGEIIGLALPQQYPHNLERGSIFYIGIMPNFRGRGYARILHEKSLEVLAGQGVREYVGSADVLNTPMVKVFQANGCQLKEIRTEELP